jgi:hypothetical protein
MMPAGVLGALFLLALLQQTPPQQTAAVSPQRFVGTWVGLQSWAIENPPPGARQDQPVTVTFEMVGGRLVGTMVPFLGGQEGATFVDSKIVGDELRVSALMSRLRPPSPDRSGTGAAQAATDEEPPGGPPNARGRRSPTRNWKDPVAISFVFKNDGTSLTGTADVTMGDVPWLKFKYDLSRKRSRY